MGLAQIGHQRGILFRAPGSHFGLHVIGENGIEHHNSSPCSIRSVARRLSCTESDNPLPTKPN